MGRIEEYESAAIAADYMQTRSIERTAEKFGCAVSTVCAALDRHGIRRTQGRRTSEYSDRIAKEFRVIKKFEPARAEKRRGGTGPVSWAGGMVF